MTSWQARAVVWASEHTSDAVIMRAFSRPPRRRRTAATPGWVRRRWDVEEVAVGAGAVATVTPRGVTRAHLVFLHGGAYTMQDFHWPMLAGLLRRGLTVSFVDYPLAPEHTVDDAVPMVEAAWRGVVEQADGVAPALVGDSAGGGLSLVLAQRLRDAGGPMPSSTVLLSPWVDLVLDDAASVAADADDPLLTIAALHAAARLYAGGRALADPELSPLHGGLHDLGRVTSYVGTRELFLPQCQRLADLAAAAPGTDHELRVAPGLAHDWGLLPFVPESGRLLDEVADLVLHP